VQLVNYLCFITTASVVTSGGNRLCRLVEE
jgi:hypothetical protein